MLFYLRNIDQEYMYSTTIKSINKMIPELKDVVSWNNFKLLYFNYV